MSTDLETQLATLGRHLNDTVGHVSAGEILMHANGGSMASAALEPGRDDTPIKTAETADRRPRWLVAVAAALIVVLVGSLALIRSSDEDRPPSIDDPTTSTEVSETTSPPTTVPTVVDPPAPAPSFAATGSMEWDCFECPAILLDDGRVFVGGVVIQVYDPATETFASVAQLEDYGGYAEHATLLADGRVMMASVNGDLVIFDPDTGFGANPSHRERPAPGPNRTHQHGPDPGGTRRRTRAGVQPNRGKRGRPDHGRSHHDQEHGDTAHRRDGRVAAPRWQRAGHGTSFRRW